MKKKWLWAFALLPLACLPLIAQETAPRAPPTQTPAPTPVAQPAASPTPVAQPASSPAQDKDAAEPVSEDKPEPADERISADKTISFPVDI